MKYIFIIASLFHVSIIYGQPIINVAVSSDTIEIGKTVEVKYTIQNGDGKFIMPVLDSLPVISGPNSSSSFMYQNGEQSFSQSYSFILLAIEEGMLKIPKTTYWSKAEEIQIDPLEIVVVTSMKDVSLSSKKSKKVVSKSKREKRVF